MINCVISVCVQCVCRHAARERRPPSFPPKPVTSPLFKTNHKSLNKSAAHGPACLWMNIKLCIEAVNFNRLSHLSRNRRRPAGSDWQTGRLLGTQGELNPTTQEGDSITESILRAPAIQHRLRFSLNLALCPLRRQSQSQGLPSEQKKKKGDTLYS